MPDLGDPVVVGLDKRVGGRRHVLRQARAGEAFQDQGAGEMGLSRPDRPLEKKSVPWFQV